VWRRRRSDETPGERVTGSDRMWRVRPGGALSAAAIVAEAVAIVEGRASDVAPDNWSPLPWTWINRLAHSSWDDINRMAESRWRALRAWEGATTLLAYEMRTYARTPKGLLRLQRSALIPLELDVLSGQVSAPDTPLELVRLVRQEVDKVGRIEG
jgi:hypothetical protein